MKDRNLETLIRMALEAEQLDAAPEFARQPARGRAYPLRVSPLAVGIAAALLVFAFNRSPVQPPEPTHGGAVAHLTRPQGAGVSVCHLPAMGAGASHVETFEPRVSEPATLLAILRTWSEDCDCLAWRLHEWRDGSLVKDVEPGESVSIEVASGDQPSIQQVVLLAVAKNHAALATVAENDASVLLDCLNSRQLATGADLEPAAYANSVAACLPPDVTVIPQTYIARK